MANRVEAHAALDASELPKGTDTADMMNALSVFLTKHLAQEHGDNPDAFDGDTPKGHWLVSVTHSTEPF